MKSYTLLIVMLLSLAFSANAQLQRTHYGDGHKPEHHQLNVRFGDIIYDQSADHPNGGYIVSQFFTDEASADLSSEAADDFVVPEGETWTVGSFGVWGTWWPESAGNPEKIDIAIYQDDDGKPGDLIDAYGQETDFYEEEWISASGEHESYYNFTFPTPLSFTEGHYWISFQVHDSYDKVGQWGWQDTPLDILEPWHWRNPGGGFPNGSPEWKPSTQIHIFGYKLNLRFALYGDAYNNDLAAYMLVNPENGQLTNQETITIKIKNEGKLTQTGFDVAYAVNGGSWITENVGALSVGQDEIAEYTFTTKADLSATGFFDISFKTLLPGDEQLANDEMTKQVVNYGVIYPMVNGDTVTYTTCSGTFTDMGGIEGPIGPGGNGVVTFFPGEAGKKIKLDFFGEFGVYHPVGGVKPFRIFDGPDVNSPLLGEWTQNDPTTPDVIKALNPTGALTIRYKRANYGDPVPGWTAIVSCYQQPDDDFEMRAFSINPTLVFTDREITLTATVRNIGNLAMSKDVTFYVNDVAVGTVNTGEVLPIEYATVAYVHEFTESGMTQIKAALPADGGDDPNFMAIETMVYLNGWFVEMFDDGYFPPEDWDPGVAWSGTTASYSGAGAAQCNVPTLMRDTLTSPRLVIHDGDILTFYAATSLWWPGNLEIAWKNGETGEWQLIEYIDLGGSQQYKKYEVDISAAAGENYLGFIDVADVLTSYSGRVMLDHIIGIGTEYYYFENDMKMIEFNPYPTPSKNEPIDYQVTVKNNGHNALNAGDYTVKIMKVAEGGDVVMASVPGVAINHLQEKTITLSVTFDKIGPEQIYAVVDLPGDQKPQNDSSIVRPVYVQVNGTTPIVVGEGTYESNQIPSSLGTAWGLSQVVYPADLVSPNGETGYITGLSYHFNNINTAPTLNVPVHIFVTETENVNVADGYINGTQMIKVAETRIDLPRGLNQQVYIPFTVPYNYQGSNLCVMFFKPRETNFQSVKWLTTEMDDDSISAYSSSYNPPLDPYNVREASMNFKNLMPNTTFYIANVGTADVSGTVTNQMNNPVEGALVNVLGFEDSTYSAANGTWSLEGLLAWETILKASKYGYYDNSIGTILFEGENNVVDFTLKLLPSVSVTATVVGNDDPMHYMEGAEVTLKGYENYSATVGADGSLMIPNVFGSKTYSLTINMEGYNTYTTSVAVDTINKDLGTITLTETLLSPFYTHAMQTNPGTVKVNWMSPLDGECQLLTYDAENSNGYAAEVGEVVWLGNVYEMEPGTITYISAYWAQYGATSGNVRMDLVDSEGNVFYSSDSFETVQNGWVNIDVPNITFEGGTFYAMAYWDGTNPDLTDYLAVEQHDAGVGYNKAYIMYPGEAPYLLSELLTGNFTFLIDVQIITAAEPQRYNEGYNIFRGPYADINNWESWQKINNQPVVGNEYIDGDWPQPEEGYTYGVQAVYTTGNSEPSFSMPIVHDTTLPCVNPWSYTVTGSLHTINIPISADVHIFGEPLMVGDWIGVFYLDDNGNEVCGGAGRWGGPFAGGNGGAIITAYGDDITTPEKDGFAEGETIRWRMNDCSAWEEYPAVATYNPNKPNMGQFADFGLSSVLSLEVMYCQYYTFAQGWNSLSSYINPIDPDVEIMFAPMINQLVIVRNTTQVYWPEENVNTLVNWDSNTGYVLKATEEVQFEICGSGSVDGQVVMENAGWYFLPVLSACPANIEELFGEQISDVIIIQELIGSKMYWPSQEIYTLQELTPGKAYKIKVATPMTLQFPMCDGYDMPGAITVQNHIVTPWGTLNMTPATQTVSFDARALAQFATGDVIGAFNSSNKICGFMPINNSGKNQSMVLFGDDVTTTAHDGYTENETISFRMIGKRTGEESVLQVQWDNATDNTSGMFISESLSKILAIDQTTTSIGSLAAQSAVAIYPNPATDHISISIQTETMDQAEATIIDTKGNVMLQQALNQRQTEMNISTLSTGIYFVKITSRHFNKVSKLIVQ